MTAGTASESILRCNLPPGSHQIRFSYEFAVFKRRLGERSAIHHGMHLADWPDAIHRWRKEFTLPLKVVPRDQPIVRLVSNRKLASSIRKAIHVELFLQNVQVGGTYYGGQNGIILVDPVPVSLGFEVFCRAGGVEKRVGAFAVPVDASIQNVGWGSFELDPETLFPEAAKVDIVLRASTAPAELTIEIDEIWDGEIVIQHVPLRAVNQ